MSHHSWNLLCYIFIWYKIWLLFCLFVGIDVLYIWFHINSLLEQHLLIHFCLHAFPTFISGKMENMLLIRSFFTLESWNTESNPLWRLPNKKQWVFFLLLNKTATKQWWEGGLGEVREGSPNKVCLLRWGMSWGWSMSEVENTSAVDTPINLQSQLCLF